MVDKARHSPILPNFWEAVLDSITKTMADAIESAAAREQCLTTLQETSRSTASNELVQLGLNTSINKLGNLQETAKLAEVCAAEWQAELGTVAGTLLRWRAETESLRRKLTESSRQFL